MATPGGAGPDPAPASAPSSTVRSTVRTLLSFAETRARLAANEFEEQLLRLLEVAAWAVAAVFFFAIAVLLVSLFIVLVFYGEVRCCRPRARIHMCSPELRSLHNGATLATSTSPSTPLLQSC